MRHIHCIQLLLVLCIELCLLIRVFVSKLVKEAGHEDVVVVGIGAYETGEIERRFVMSLEAEGDASRFPGTAC